MSASLDSRVGGATPVRGPGCPAMLDTWLPGEASHGFIVVAVTRSALAPHAVIVNQGFRYPRRNGTTTRHLSEPEVASAYRVRFAGARRQVARIEEVEHEALQQLETSGLPW